MKIHPLWAPGLALALAGCEADDWGPETLYLGKSDMQIQQLRKGRDVYAMYCVGCHGEKGDGEGPAARFLDPKPRDFTRGRIKFAAVESGEAPRHEDYLAILDHGLSGTSMPSFALLSRDDKAAVIAYVRAFYAQAAEETSGAGIALEADPWRDDPAEGVAAGERVYHGLAKCWSCHPAYVSRARIAEINREADLPAPELRDDLYQSTEKDSQWGAPIRAPDFYADRVKTGLAVNRLVQVIAAGVGGTAMPTWAGSLDAEQLWGLAYYVRSVALYRGTAEGRAKMAELAANTSTKAE